MRVFVDFWNCALSMRNVAAGFRMHWAKLGPTFAHAAAVVVDAGPSE